jgi:hypothetical protein
MKTPGFRPSPDSAQCAKPLSMYRTLPYTITYVIKNTTFVEFVGVHHKNTTMARNPFTNTLTGAPHRASKRHRTTTVRVTIENFWARRGRELSQILTEELFILGIWECS